MCTMGYKEDNHWHSRSVNSVSVLLLLVNCYIRGTTNLAIEHQCRPIKVTIITEHRPNVIPLTIFNYSLKLCIRVVILKTPHIYTGGIIEQSIECFIREFCT